ncbi:MAG: VWA domain-containing protein [Acidobacteriota bacterium]
MRHRYSHLDPELLQKLLAGQELEQLFNRLLLSAGGDAEAAMDWMRQLQNAGYISEDVDLEEFFQQLVDRRMLEADSEGNLSLSSGGERRLRRGALEEIFSGLSRSGPGFHAVRSAGEGIERLPESRAYRFGDDLQHLDASSSLKNALRHGPFASGPLQLEEDDLVVYETEHLTSCATVLAIDISHSMILYGEDRITPAKTVALAMAELITTRYPKDYLGVLLFGDRAEPVELSQLPYIEAGPYHTNTAEALQLARGLLARKRQPNKQIFLITDGKPSAMTMDDGRVFKNPYGLDMRIVTKTLDEADVCRRQQVVISTFMIATDPTLTAFVERLTQVNRGRAFFASPDSLGEFIFADYLTNRRKRVR